MTEMEVERILGVADSSKQEGGMKRQGKRERDISKTKNIFKNILSYIFMSTSTSIHYINMYNICVYEFGQRYSQFVDNALPRRHELLNKIPMVDV